MKRFTSVLVGIIAYVAWLGADEARAVTCSDTIQGHVDWLVAAPGDVERSVAFVLVSNRGQTPLLQTELRATYIEGGLAGKNSLVGAVLAGTGTRYYSDRRWSENSFGFPNFPFDPDQTEAWKLTLYEVGNKATLKRSTTVINIANLECENGVIHGFSFGGSLLSPATMYVISLKRQESSIPQ